MQLVYESKVIDDPKVHLVENLKETIFWLEGIDDTRDYEIWLDKKLYNILRDELVPLDDLPRPDLKMFLGYKYIEDNSIEDGCYCIYRKDEQVKVKEYSDLNEWWNDLPLYNKAKIFLNCNKSLYISSWDNLTEQEREIMENKT